MIYLYITPSGSVNLIEGDKMPVKPEDRVKIESRSEFLQVLKDGLVVWSRDIRADDYAYSNADKHATIIKKSLSNEYEDMLQAAKASSVPVDDSLGAIRIIQDKLRKDNPNLPAVTFEDTFYGPFDIGYEIGEEPIPCPDNIEGCEVYHFKKVAFLLILLPENEPNQLSGRDFFQTIPACNWEEDYAHENGNYINKCGDCGFYFKGHKRRVRCKICSGPDLPVGKLEEKEVSPRVAKLLLGIRDELAKLDQCPEEAYHLLYQIASPNFDKTEPWAELEKIAKRGSL